MIAVILAAGKGSRLGDKTNDLPKSLLPLNENETLLDYNLDILNKLNINKIFIVTGFKAETIVSHVKGQQNIQCIYNPFWSHCNVLGSLFMALQYLDDDFLFLHADTLVGFQVWETLWSYGGSIVLPYKAKKCGEEEMKVKHDINGKLIEVSKTMDYHQADGEFLGIAKFTLPIKHQMQRIAEQLFQRGKLDYYMEAAVQELIVEHEDVRTFEIGSAPFVEVDFLEDYEHAQNILMSPPNRFVVHTIHRFFIQRYEKNTS